MKEAVLNKKCKTCGEVKPVEEFYFDVKRCVLRSDCKCCQSNYAREYLQNHPEKKVLYSAEKYKEWYSKNRSKKLGQAKNYYSENKEKIILYTKKWAESNPQKVTEYINKRSVVRKTTTKRKKINNYRSWVYGVLGVGSKELSYEDKKVILINKIMSRQLKKTFNWKKRVWNLAKTDIDHALEALFKKQITKKENLL